MNSVRKNAHEVEVHCVEELGLSRYETNPIQLLLLRIRNIGPHD